MVTTPSRAAPANPVPPDPDPGIQPGDGDPEHDRTDPAVDAVQDTQLAEAHQQLAVARLDQQVVELVIADVLDEAQHVRLDGGAHHPADQHVHAHHRQELGGRPGARRRPSTEAACPVPPAVASR
jgi:hypothetical protein